MNTPNLNPSRELMGCPFCGGEATYQWHSSPECWIECQTCFAVGPNDKDTTTEQHVVGWNTRALSQTLPAPGEVDYAEAARVMFEACPDRFMRAEQCYPAIDALAAAGFFATSRSQHERASS